MRNCLFIAILFTIVQNDAVSQSNKTDFNNVLSHIESLRKNRPVESIYIHFDKPYYASGDTIYFKAYVTLNELHRLTTLSEVVHVDLISPQNKIINSIKLKLKQGTAYADFELPDSLPAGTYRVRAYTKWMLNEGSGSFFKQIIPVGSVKRSSRQSNIPGSQLQSSAPDIRFFPEGGELLTGVESKVAFKAIGNNGLGSKVKGIVLDNDGKEITRFQSVHLGMGFFYLKPQEGKLYHAKLTFSDGSNSIADLPKANLTGMVLSAGNESMDTAIVNILTSKEYFKKHQNEDITLLIYSAGAPSVTHVKLNSENIDFAINKQHLHSGIMRITLFSSQLEPMSERLLFIKNPDQINLQVKSDKPAYNKREKVEISLSTLGQTKGRLQGNFSVSVINEDVVKTDENKESTITSNLLLTSEINGYVEQPNYYFMNSGDEVAANLDILMLTQGYRHFLWKQILIDSLEPLQYKAERFFQLQGSVKTGAGKPAKNEKVTLTDTTGRGPELTETTDSAGRFIFKNLEFTDTMHFSITPANSTSHIILSNYQSPMVKKEDIPEALSDVNSAMPAYLKITTLDQKFKAATNVKLLEELTITSKKQDNTYFTESLAGTGNADQVLHANEIHGGGLLSDQLKGRLGGVTFIDGAPILTTNLGGIGQNKPTPMMVVVDGVAMSGSNDGVGTPFNVDEINLNDIETVEVLKMANTSIYGMDGGGGVLVITTKKTMEIEVDNSFNSNELHAVVMGFYKAREFYSPKYEIANVSNKGQDLRTTLFWKPEVITDKDGNASFNYYNADIGGIYRVVVEGIDENGNIGRQVYRYRVQ